MKHESNRELVADILSVCARSLAEIERLVRFGKPWDHVVYPPGDEGTIRDIPNLKSRPKQALEDNGITTIRQLISVDKYTLESIPGFGRDSVDTIEKYLLKRGLYLSRDVEV